MTTPVHNRKLKQITLSIGGEEFQTQLRNWTLNNGTGEGEGEVFYTYGGDDSSFVEDAEDSWTLSLEFYSDWRSEGISDWIFSHNKETVAFVIDHHPDIPAEHVRWEGEVKVKAPSVGGEVRTTEITSAEWTCNGEPEYSRP
ncbi:hypothetical protein [Pseudonocardia pini]|uniref:hypothetical protein n=1 Tax=Pseudonocardia pini TaxID=2758030 RepID=UPI0015F07D6A|nr:hypothetical protein [Pseudonocardia pini]